MFITPEYVSILVNFYSNTLKPEWKYNPNEKDMRNLQVKGAAKVYNLLEEHGLALLADEVGMGKTIQALAVCAALWNEKPEAKVLIFAPRDEIAKNWEKEYQTFIRHHYRNNDNLVKSISGMEPVRKMIYCPNLYSLVHEVQQGWGQLFIGKISSFSSLMARKDVIKKLEDLNIRGLGRVRSLAEKKDRDKEYNNEIVRLLKNEIDSHSKEKKAFFDLVIVDEAHYLRKKDGDSLRVNSAREFFGDPFSDNCVPLASKVLLLTATPNHSSSKDIGNIVSYFTDVFRKESYDKILEKICVRRLRRLSKNGYNKYHYRHEIAAPSDFKENPLSEMFFGLYQHELAKELNRNKTEKFSDRGISRMMKYLEGVEFIPFEKQQPQSEGSEEESKSNSSDYTTGSDTQILLEMSRKFNEIFVKNPKHPKYDKLVEDLTVKQNGEKAVVFVRRIPSVYEIAKRIVEFYDKRMWDKLKKTGLETLPYEKLDRISFKKRTSTLDPKMFDEEINEGNAGDDTGGNIPSSKVMNLFKIIKNDPVKSTQASNFRLRFNHSKPNIFAIFFGPGEDYFSQPYTELVSYKFEVGNEELENFYSSVLLHRTNKIKDKGKSKDIISILLPKIPVQNSGEVKDFKIHTLLTIFWEVFLMDMSITESEREKIKNVYQEFSYYEKEAFSNFLEKGTLLASESLIWFYEIFRKIQEVPDEKPSIVYQQFVEFIKRDLKNSKLYIQIQESILYFIQIYTKVFSINGEKDLLNESWDSFNNAQPIYPYNADNSNQKVLRCFNTPFFPDYLVATSVLQEGVNLQYFCDTIYHYGMAWTPGDNEQRIGRIDRMFGKIERLLEKSRESKLHIYYPYLKDTVDEEHLARFVKRKYIEEALIDKGKAFKETADFPIEENETGAWTWFLRKPDNNSISDPFPVGLYDFIKIRTPYLRENKYSLSTFYQSISNSLKSLAKYKSKIFLVEQEDNQKLLIDPTLYGDRKQPVIIELVIDHIATGFMGESVFCLRMRTPLAPYSKFKTMKNQFYESQSIQSLYTPGIKLCLDSSQTSGTSWGLYMSNELPLFITDVKNNPLSIEEIQEAFVNLIKCADLTEKEIFQKDLILEELNLPLIEPVINTQINFRNSKPQNLVNKWKQIGNYYVLERESDINLNSHSEKQSFIDNHSNYFVKTFFEKTKLKYQVAYLTKDAHTAELQVLEKHLDVFIKGFGW